MCFADCEIDLAECCCLEVASLFLLLLPCLSASYSCSCQSYRVYVMSCSVRYCNVTSCNRMYGCMYAYTSVMIFFGCGQTHAFVCVHITRRYPTFLDRRRQFMTMDDD